MQDQVVIITGASSGIGRALAFECGRQGAKLVITGRNKQRLEETQKALQAQGYGVLALVADVSQEEDNQEVVKKTIEEFGKINVLINNAGISMRAVFEDLDLDVIRRLMDINFYGTIYATKYALPHIIEQKGSVIGISSIAGHVGLPGRTGYSASKYAMNGFLNTLRVEMRAKGVHVMVVAPGFTESNIRKTALNRTGEAQGESPRKESGMMTADTVAQKVVKALKKRKRSLVLTREGQMAVFLYKWMPGLIDNALFKKMAREPDSPLQKNN